MVIFVIKIKKTLEKEPFVQFVVGIVLLFYRKKHTGCFFVFIEAVFF